MPRAGRRREGIASQTLRRCVAALLVGFAALLPSPSLARGWHGGPHIVIGTGFFWSPYFYERYGYPYPYYPPPPPPYYYYPPYYPPPTPPAREPSASRERRTADDEAARTASYGLVQLRGVPDGASVDLDGRFWLRAEKLDQRWLALPAGAHTLVVRAEEGRPVERRVRIDAGETHVVRFESRRPS
jgi:hypothetical protein